MLDQFQVDQILTMKPAPYTNEAVHSLFMPDRLAVL